MLTTAVVLFVKNEVEDIVSWLSWHFYCGFNSIIVYDDFSTDGTWEILAQAAKIYDIKCHRAVGAEQFNLRQRETYIDAINRYRNEFDWLLFLDGDEYLELKNGEKVHSFLENYPEAHAIALNWCCYGSNNHVIKPPTANVFENYTKRSNLDFEYNYIVKSFIRPKYTESIYLNPHRFSVAGPYLTTDHKPVVWQERHPERTQSLAQWDVARVNHYVIRSVHHYLEKMKRRVDIRESGMGLDLFKHCDRNEHFETLTSSLYDGMSSWIYGIQNVINRNILNLMVATQGRGLNGEISSFDTLPEDALSAYILRTTHETTVCYSKETGRISHHHNYKDSVSIEPIIAIQTSLFPDIVFLTTLENKKFLHTTGEMRFSTVLSYKIEKKSENLSALRSPLTGLAMSFVDKKDTEENVEVNRCRAREWELVEMLPIDTTIKLDMELFKSVFHHISNPSYLNVEENSHLTADLFISVLQTFPEAVISYWMKRNNFPL